MESSRTNLKEKTPLVLCWLLTLPYLVAAVTIICFHGQQCWKMALEWYDPRFTQYNLALLMMAVLIVPWITYFYVTKMKGEKDRRLLTDLREDYFENEEFIKTSIDSQFRFQSYLGGMIILMVIITLGAAVLLLFKPVMNATDLDDGVDYAKGANFILLGPFIEYYSKNPDAFYHQVIIGLTAFIFGFLGAYTYFLLYLVRSFFILDLTSKTFVFSAVRMATSSIFAVVLSFILPTFLKVPGAAKDSFPSYLPFLAFFLGFFPSQALKLIKNAGTRFLGAHGPQYNATPVSELPGMSLGYEVMLEREGLDSLEDISQLSRKHAIGLAINTGFSYLQLCQWIDYSWLRVHLGPNDYATFKQHTGLTNRQELLIFLNAWKDQGQIKAEEHLAAVAGGKFANKINIICRMLMYQSARKDDANAMGGSSN